MPGPKDLGTYHDGKGNLEAYAELSFSAASNPESPLLGFVFAVKTCLMHGYVTRHTHTLLSMGERHTYLMDCIHWLGRYEDCAVEVHPAGPDGAAAQAFFVAGLESRFIPPLVAELADTLGEPLQVVLTVKGCHGFVREMPFAYPAAA